MTNFDKPKFITFEGGEGSGKTTQSKMLHEYLLSKSIKSIHTREIGGTLEAEKIRNLLIYSNLYSMSELMLVMAARYEHINKVIVPALLSGSWVICDRFVDSTACYQSGDSGLTMTDIYDLHAKLMLISYVNEVENVLKPEVNIHDYEKNGIMPDITFFMDVSPVIGLKRVQERGDANKFEDKHIAFHQQVYDRFKEIASANSQRVRSIDCQDRTVAEIHQRIINSIFDFRD